MTASGPAASPKQIRRQKTNWNIWLLYLVGLIPAGWTFWLGASGQLGADPVKSFEHLLGLWALRFLILTLAISPLRDLTGISLLRYRRALGLLAFYYVGMHFLTYLLLDQGMQLAIIWQDIVKRPYITIGMACLLMLVPLAVTSNNWSIRKLGRKWQYLHRLIYVIAIGGAVHFLMSVKSWPAEPIIYLAIILILVGWRLVRKILRPKRKAALHNQ